MSINLVIGSTSQLSYYFPDDYVKVSSRDSDEVFSYNKSDEVDSVYICFAEQRTYVKNKISSFHQINVNYTLDVINHFLNISNRIVVYGTCGLWNLKNGPISIDDKFSFDESSQYLLSKMTLIDLIKSDEKLRDKVIILHPFNFNSIYRKDNFLFYKIFDSIINKKCINIKNTYFYRDIIHPSYVVERSLVASSDEIVGSGRLIFINDFIRKLYNEFDMNYDDYVTEDITNGDNDNVFYLYSKNVKYNETVLFNKTVSEIKSKINE